MMNKVFSILTFLALGLSFQAHSQARVQIVHNCADPAAAVVDIYANGALLPELDNVPFRASTPFLTLPAGNYTIEIKGPNSTVSDPAIFTKNLTLANNETYQVIAAGTVLTTNYPGSLPFDLFLLTGAREQAAQQGANQTDLVVFHGSANAPTVDANEVVAANAQLVNDLSFGQFTSYLSLPTADYNVQLRTADNQLAILEYSAPLATLTLQNAALTVLASGWLEPVGNDAGFGLFVVNPAGGAFIALPVVDFTPAKVQIIHNSADAAAALVDVWVDNALVKPNFAFRTNTSFIDFPVAGLFDEASVVQLKAPNSSAASPAVFEAEVKFVTDSYIVIANGIASGSGYTPGSAARPLTLAVHRGAKTQSATANTVDLLIHHGSTDAPTVDVIEPSLQATLANDLAYGQFVGYINLPTSNYLVQIRDQSGTVVVATYEAPLSLFNNLALTVVASGFLTPGQNSDGPAFGLFAAGSQEGALIELPLFQPTATAGFVHNSADMAANQVDVFINGELTVPNFPFRGFTGYIDFPAGSPITVDIRVPNNGPTVLSQTFTFEEGENYLVIVDGIASPTGYNPGPVERPLSFKVFEGARIEANLPSEIDVLVHHGSTDAPVVDIQVVGGTIDATIDDVAYGDFAGYVGLPANANYEIRVKTSDGATTVQAYSAPVQTLGFSGQAVTIIASGFLTPSANSNGASFGLFAAVNGLDDLFELPLVASIADVNNAVSAVIYPNPANETAFINYDLTSASAVTYELMDVSGKVLNRMNLGTLAAGKQTIELPVNDLSNGFYIVRLTAGNQTANLKLTIKK